MSEPVWECFVCGKPVSNATAHFCHRDGCKRIDCDCDYPCHPGCCPECNPIDKKGKDNAKLLLKIGLYLILAALAFAAGAMLAGVL